MEATPANFKAYVDQAIKNATKPLYEKIAAQTKTINEQSAKMRKLEQRLNAYDARLKTRQLVTDDKGVMLKGAVEVRDKMTTLNKLHDFAHGRHVTASRAKELKTKIGEAVVRRSAPRGSAARSGSATESDGRSAKKQKTRR